MGQQKFNLQELFGSEDSDSEETEGTSEQENVTIIDNPIDDPGDPEEAEEGEPQDAGTEDGAVEDDSGEAEEEEEEEEEPEPPPPPKATKKKSAKKKAKAKKKAAPPPEEDEEEEEEEQGSALVVPEKPGSALAPVASVGGGLMKASWGAKVARYPIEKYRGSSATKDRICIPLLTDAKGEPMLFISKRHYSDETGGFYCFEQDCCEHLGLPDVRYNFPILVYDTDKKGVPVSAEFEVMYLQAPESRYEEFLTYIENGKDLTDIDFVITCEDENYQKLKLAAFEGAIWRKNKQFAKMVVDKLLKAWAFAPQVIANKMTRERMLEKLGVTDTGDAPPAEGNFDLDSFLKG